MRCFLFFILFLFTLSANSLSLVDKNIEINSLWDRFKDKEEIAYLGIDIGGTKIDWAIYPYSNGKLEKKKIASGSLSTPKGVLELVESYYQIVINAILLSGNANYHIAGIGVGSPGRFINYKNVKKDVSNDILDKIGNPFVPIIYDSKEKFSSSSFNTNISNRFFLPAFKTIANNSAINLGNNANEFDGIVLQDLFQRVSPKDVQVYLENDAATQLLGIISDLDKNLVANKKIIYVALGTGLGSAIISKNGSIVTDDHFQFIEINQIFDTQTDIDVFDIIRAKNFSKYQKINSKSIAILPEDIFSGIGISNILKETFRVNWIPMKFDSLMELKKYDSNFHIAEERLKSIGKYMGRFFAKIYYANFEHIDHSTEWSEANKLEIKNFDTIIFGGGIGCCSKFFKDIIFPEIQKELKNYDLLDKISFIFSDNKTEPSYSSASLCLKKWPLILTFDDGPTTSWTPKILDLLKTNSVKAIFFVIGNNINENTENILRRIAEDGHEIAVHTFTHPDLRKLSDEQIADEIKKTIDAIHSILPNYKIRFFRPPYGAINKKIESVIESLGLTTVLWTIDSNEYLKIATPKYIKNRIEPVILHKHGGIILLHDGGGDAPRSKDSKYSFGRQNVVDYIKDSLTRLKETYEFQLLKND